MSKWSTDQAISWCIELERIAKKHGGHVALTGGTLYGQGLRKDLDIVIYRSADEPKFNWDEFFAEVELFLGITRGTDFGYCKKAKTEDGLDIDFFDPFEEGEYHLQGEQST